MDLVSTINFYSKIGNNVFKQYNELGRPILDFFHIIFDNLFYFFLFLAIIISAVYYIMSLYSLFNKKKYPEKEFIKEIALFVSIQIPTYNELVALRCAKKCLKFDYPKNKFEIVIGDDSDNASVSKKITSFAENHDNVIVTRRGSNLGYKSSNLNHMLKYSKGEVIVIFDSDFVPEKDFLKRIITPFIHDPSISGVQARWKFLDQNKNIVSVLGSTIITVFHHICLPFINRNANISFLCGSAEAVKKKDLLKLGGWEPGSLTEDIEFSLRLLKNGKKIVYLDQLECAGEVPHKARDLYKQQMRWAYGVIYSFREHFKTIFINKNISFKNKFYIVFFCSGYLLSLLLILLLFTGTLSFVTHTPGPIDLTRFFSELGRNVFLTSGIIVASVFAMIKTKNLRKLIVMVIASFSLGLVVTYYVNMGIFKVLFKRPMKWYMLSKEGNKAAI